ncbi:MAG TPA: thiamine pyrophosphate-dependent enzyme, partial [Pseudogracilibacillus sp.]|nr:thiamine pyrophosphate-dependent enzyme [Pseudogracilibacillus sp.]
AEEELQAASSEELTEGTAVRQVIEQLGEKSHLFVANSMPVRDVDSFLLATEKQINIYANRGVSGIDGTMSSALGVAASGKHVTLLIGDLSFYHDLNSLLIAKRYQLPITIVLINNNGGGIFSFLPQAKEEKYFEHLFGTPLDIDFKHAVDLYEGNYNLVKSEAELASVLKKSKTLNQFSVIELQTNRAENVTWHRDLWAKIVKRLEADDTL